jgi:hypothetical protein
MSKFIGPLARNQILKYKELDQSDCRIQLSNPQNVPLHGFFVSFGCKLRKIDAHNNFCSKKANSTSIPNLVFALSGHTRIVLANKPSKTDCWLNLEKGCGKRMNKKGLELDNFFKVEEMHHCWQYARAKKKKKLRWYTGDFSQGWFLNDQYNRNKNKHINKR